MKEKRGFCRPGESKNGNFISSPTDAIIGCCAIVPMAAALVGSASTMDMRMRNLSELAKRRHFTMSPP